MKKKTIGVLLIISLIMIICIGAVSAADTNETLREAVSDTDTLQGEVSDVNSETTSLTLKQESNASSLENEVASDVEKLSVSDNGNEINREVNVTSSDSNDVLSSSNDDLLGDNPNFYYAGTWYQDLDDAVDAACDNGGGTIYLTYKPNGWGYDSAERQITISDAVSITFEPYNPGDQIIFDGKDYSDNTDNYWWFFKITDKNAKITFNNITFRNGGDGPYACDGGALRIIHGQVTLNNCIFSNNKATQNSFDGHGWGGAIFLDESDASLIANNCQFINNIAQARGGAVCVEDGASATFNYCYFKGNTGEGSADHVYDKDDGTHSFYMCRFIGSGSIDYEVNIFKKTVTLTAEVEDEDVNYAVLYKDGEEYDKIACNPDDTVTFGNDIESGHGPLEAGTYIIYMMKNEEKIYEFSSTNFTIVEPNFILNDEKVFENLTDAINAISSGESAVIKVENDIFTDSANFNVQIINKDVTIMPKDLSSEADDAIFYADSQRNYLLYVSSNSKLTIYGITIKGKYSYAALKFETNSECNISE